jgi:hypothetical protein
MTNDLITNNTDSKMSSIDSKVIAIKTKNKGTKRMTNDKGLTLSLTA